MQDDREIQLCEPSPFLFCGNGQLAVTDGSSVWMVIVTDEAMTATTSRQETSLRTLFRYAEFYRGLAAAAIRAGEDVDGKVWITEAMVLAFWAPANKDLRGGHLLSGRGYGSEPGLAWPRS